jgi:hypothetical protein
VPKSDSCTPVRLNDLLFLRVQLQPMVIRPMPSFCTSRLSMEVIREKKQGCHAKCEISEIHGPQPVTSDRRGCAAWLAECERCSIHLSTILPDEDLVFHPLGVERIEPSSNPTRPEILDAVEP